MSRRSAGVRGSGSSRSVLLACAALLGLYLVVALAGDVRAWSASDPGGKLATIRAMSVGGPTHVDIGYWAADLDPEGRMHPVLNTERSGDEWVQSTPPLFALAGYVLHGLAGIPGILAMTFAGGVATALGARAIARFLIAGSGSDADAATAGWAAFWLTGAGSVTVHYVADVWEHVPATGLAIGGFGLAARTKVSPARAALVGLALGGACALRREVVLWVLAMGVAVVVTPVLRRAWTPIAAVCAAASAAAVLAASLLLERWIFALDSADRVSNQASDFSLLEGRGDDILYSTFAVGPGPGRLAGAAVVVAAVLLGVAATRHLGTGPRRSLTALGALLAVAGYASQIGKLLLVPGAVPSQPFVGAAAGARRPELAVALAGVVPWPIVWMVQWRGGMAFQFGGRYLMVGSALLVVSASVAVTRRGWDTGAARLLVALSVVVALWSAAVHVERTSTLASAGEEVARITGGDVVALTFPFGRDTVAVRPEDSRWLQALAVEDLERTVEIARSRGESSFWVVSRTGSRATLPAEQEAARIAAGEGSLGLVVVEQHEVDHLRGGHLSVVRVQVPLTR